MNQKRLLRSGYELHSNAAFWLLQERLKTSTDDAKLIAELKEEVSELQCRLHDTQLRLQQATARYALNQHDMVLMEKLKGRLCFWEPGDRLLEDLAINIFHQAGDLTRSNAAQVCKRFSEVIKSGRARGAFNVDGCGIAAGDFHTVICTSKGRLLTFGYGKYGRLGHGGDEDEKVPRVVEGLGNMKVTQVSAGGDHTVICTSEGRVFTFGYGKYGQLGHGDTDDQMVPRIVESLVGMRVTQMSAGGDHTVICTSEGRVLTFGCGQHGRLGHGDTYDNAVPLLVEDLVGRNVTQVSAGWHHTAICTSEGRVFTFGDGAYGKLGHGGQNHETLPRLIEVLVGMKVNQVSAGWHHTAICTSADGYVLTFGEGGYGQLGHRGEGNEMVPRIVESLLGIKVAQVSAGGGHTVICTSEGRMMTFGFGEYGKLGHGGEDNEMVPRLVDLVGMRVTKVVAGGDHTVICTSEGRVMTFGDVEFGQLDHGGLGVD